MTFPEKLEGAIAALHPSWQRLAASEESAAAELRRCGLSLEDALDMTEYAISIARWRQHRAVYVLDDTLFEEFAQSAFRTSDADTIPAESLLNLPFESIAVHAQHPFTVRDADTKIQFTGTGDILIYIEGDELRTVYQDDRGEWISYFFPVQIGKTIGEMRSEFESRVLERMGVFKFNSSGKTKRIKEIRESLGFEVYLNYIAIQIVLYLQAQNSDIIKIPARKPAKKKSTKRKLSRVQSYNVGYNVGATIRREKRIYEDGARSSGASGHHTPKRPHIRRGHFHSFWTGRRDSGERKLVVKWVAPTYVHSGDQEGRVTIYPVKK